MSLDAGAVYATLGGRFSNAGFHAFGSAMYRARSDMEATEKRAQAMADRSSQSMAKMGHAAKIVAGGGILALGAGLAYSVKKAADFEQQLSSLQSVTGANARQMAQFKKQAMDAGAATKYSALQAAQAQTELAKGGLSLQKIMGGGLKGALALAAAGELDLADAAKTVSNALNLFGLNGGQATHVADALAQAANATTADVGDFAMALNQGGSAAKAAGLSFDQTVVALEALAKIGIKNSDAGTSLKTTLAQIANPTKKAAAVMDELGIKFFTAGGHIKRVDDISANLRKSLGGLTNEQRLAAVQTIAGTDGFRTLLALYDAGPQKLRQYATEVARQGTAAEVAAKKQDNLKGKVENLKGSIETAAITIGGHLLPVLTSAAEKATDFINHLAATGQLDRFAEGIIRGGGEAVHIIGDVAHVAGVAIGPVLALGDALNLGDPGHLEAILGGFLAFKAVQTVGPILLTFASGLGTALSLIGTAAASGELLALPALFAAGVSPLGAVAVAAGVAAGALILLGGSESEESALARENADAHKAQADAIKNLSLAEHASADAGLSLQQAHLDQKQAQEHVNELRKQGKTHTDAYKQAVIDLERATLRSGDAEKQYGKTLDDQHSKARAQIDTAKESLDVARKHYDQLTKQATLEARGSKTVGGKIVPTASNPDTLREQARAQQQLVAQTQSYIEAIARANVSDANRTRLMNSAKAITRDNVQGVSDLVNVISRLPKEKQAKILVQNQDALAKLGSVAAALKGVVSQKTIRTVIAGAESAKSALLALTAIAKGVPARRVTNIVANTSTARGEIAALQAAINSLHANPITIPVGYQIHGAPPGVSGGIGSGAGRRAAGRGPGGSERSLIGEGAGPEWIVDPEKGTATRVERPALLDIDPGQYVIPTEDRYRGRALGLLADLMKDLGIAGYKGGKGSKKKPHRIVPPPPKDYRVADPDVIKTELDKLAQDAKETTGTGKKKHKTAKAIEAARELPAIRKTYREAHAAKNRIDADAERAANAYKHLQNADKRDNQAGFDAALTDYKKALKGEQGGLQKIWASLGKAKKQDTKYGRHIQDLLLGVKGDAFDAKSLVNEPEQGPETEADRIASTGLTDAEAKRLKEITRDIALAALTPQLTDDQEQAGALVGLLEQALGENVARGADPGVITDLATQLKTARDNVDAFKPGSTTANDNPDLQAQLDQANRRTAAAEDSARINAQALSVFQGAGNINGGGTLILQSLVPPDATWIRALGDYATDGQSRQPSIQSPVEKVGL